MSGYVIRRMRVVYYRWIAPRSWEEGRVPAYFLLWQPLSKLMAAVGFCPDALAALVKMCVNIFCSENHLGVIALPI